MKLMHSIKRRLAETTGAVTEEFSFLTIVALAIVGALLAFFSKVPLIGQLLTKLFSALFNTLIEQIAGLFS